jgi:beta-galactosidase/beta-glucuronidase
VSGPLDHRTEHPRPLLRRAWTSLDGTWDFAVEDGPFDRQIEVPFAPETPASGVAVATVDCCTYRRQQPVEAPSGGDRLLLHFGAVDRYATVWANGTVVASHEGGYTPFTADVNEAARSGTLDITVRAVDDPADLEAPRGKQDWRETPHVIWYPRTTGIWRSVWLERVPATHVLDVEWGCSLGDMTVTAIVRVAGPADGAEVRVLLRHGDREVGAATGRVTGGAASILLPVGDGGIDDRWDLVWWPRRPVLLDAEIEVLDHAGTVVDRALSYTALREVAVRDGRFLINGRPTFLRLVLDQGYWPETGMTPPDAAALHRDLELARALGFGGVRKHQKVEDPRFLAAADELGMLVWAEMPSAYRPGTPSAQRLLREWADAIVAQRGHPSVVAWVPLNESWGVPAIATDARQRAVAEAMAATAGALDGTRPVSVNDGWETTGGDIVGIHDYSQDPAVLAQRYADAAAVEQVLTGVSVGLGGRLVDLDRRPAGDRAVVLSEFGGIRLGEGGDDWGYATATSPDDLVERYREQWRAVHASSALAGACWTQLTDTYQEANGLLRDDRTPKADLEALFRATRGRDRVT